MAPRRRSVLLPIAIGLDAVALALLGADAVASYQRSIPIVLLLSGIAIPLALAGAVTSGVLIVRTVPRVPHAVLIVGVAIATVAAVPIGGVLIAIGYSATPNPAATAEAIIGSTVEAAGGYRLCGSGDPGLGPDNTQPWFSTVYEIPAGLDLRPRITAQAQRLGWTVSSDPTEDLERTTPRLQVVQGGTEATGACEYGTVERASSGTRLLQLQVLLPYRR